MSVISQKCFFLVFVSFCIIKDMLSFESSQLLHEIGVVMSNSVVNRVVYRMVPEVVVSAGVGIVKFLSFLVLSVCLLLSDLLQQYVLQLLLFLDLSFFHFLEDIVLSLIGRLVLMSLIHKIKLVQMIRPSRYFETAVFKMLRVDNLFLSIVHSIINFFVILSHKENTC